MPHTRRGRPHPLGRLLEHVLHRVALELHRGRLEALRDLIPVKPCGPVAVERLARVLAEIPGRTPRLLKRTRPDRKITEQLDMDDPAAPRPLDQATPDEPADREMQMQTMPARMPLPGTHKYGSGFPPRSARSRLKNAATSVRACRGQKHPSPA